MAPPPLCWFVSTRYPSLRFHKLDMSDMDFLRQIFDEEKPEIICHLAAQPGVRCSIEHPELYLQNNVVAFFNLLECCRHHAIQHLIYASSSSVYGANAQVPFSPEQRTDTPASFYAATKKNDEIFAAAYSRLYRIPTTALRFFTVYGPWGRPDMAPFKFTRAILEGKPLVLTFSEFEILYLLARRPGWVYTRGQIVNEVKGDDYPVTERAIDVQMVSLRRKLGEYGSLIETVRGVGYRFVQE